MAVSAVAAATAAAVLVPMTAIGASTHHHHGGFVPAPIGATDGQMIGFHGIVLTVPGSWHINDIRCATPVGDTVVRDTGGYLACLAARPPSVSSVELFDNPISWQPRMRQVSELTNSHGVHLLRGSVAGRGDAVVVPVVGVLMFIDTTTPELEQRILDSVQMVDTDANGCPMREQTLNPPSSSQLRGAPFRPYATRYVIAPTPASIGLCHYEDNWLMSSTTVTGPALNEIVRAANSATPGLSHARSSQFSPGICDEPSAEGGEVGSGFVLHVHYPGQPDLLLWAHIGFCGPLGITNGERSGQLSLALARAIAAPLHAGFSLPS